MDPLETPTLGAGIEARRFPQELFDHIIDHLHDHKDSLCQSSLVCRDWVPASSYHLFDVFAWPPCKDRDQLCDPEVIGDCLFSSCIQRLKSSTRVCEAVRRLFLSQHICPLRGFEAQSTSITPQALVTIVDLLPRLQELVIIKCCLLRGPEIFAPRIERHLERLTIFCSTIHQPFDVLTLFRDVSKVFLHYTGNTPPDAVAPIRSPQPDTTFIVHTLDVRDHPPDFLNLIMGWLTSIIFPPSIRRFELGDELSPEACAAVQHMTSLEHLSYDVSLDHAPQGLIMPCLVSLSVTGMFTVTGYPLVEEDDTWDAIIRDLRILVTDSMREVGIILSLEEGELYRNRVFPFTYLEDWLSGRDWEGLERILDEHPRLATLRFELHPFSVKGKREMHLHIGSVTKIASRKLPRHASMLKVEPLGGSRLLAGYA